MRIGIITFHRANNYGAVLQCYALQKKLKSLGCEVKIIDYRQPFVEAFYRQLKWNIIRNWKLHFRLFLGYLLKFLPHNYKQRLSFNAFRIKYFKCTKRISRACDMPQNFDLYIIGSDQMWSLQCLGGDIDELYFGCFPHLDSSPIIGYAISSNIFSLETIGAKKIEHYIRNFKKLSFREKEVSDWMKKNVGCSCREDLDPTFLLEKSEWLKLAKHFSLKKKYILTYFVDPTILEIIDFAKEKNLDIISFEKKGVSPIDFIRYIQNAEYVITSSFHATVFSIILEKRFFSVLSGNSSDVRFINLLKTVNLYNRCIDLKKQSFSKIDEEINFVVAKKIISEKRLQSIDYLQEIIVSL